MTAPEPMYLICKHGGYYRPNCQGYTSSAAEAGRYTLAEAEKETHPNGPDGPRDGMSYIPAPADLAAIQPAQVRDLISRMDAIQACQVGPSDEWAKATKSGYDQAATDCQRNILRIKPSALEPQPDPRDEVIARLVEALEFYADEDTYETQYERMPCDCCTDIFEPINADKGSKARAALAAAKAVQK